MYKHFILCTIAIFAILPILAQTNTFQKTYGGPGDEEAFSVQQTSDGGYILAGYTKSYGPGNFENAYLIRTDSMGDLVWSKTYGVSGGASKFRSVKQTGDGGFIVAGWIYESPTNGHDILLVKTDAAGNETWTRRFGGPGNDSAYSVQIDNDGGYIITGGTSNTITDFPSPFILKTNASGTPVIFNKLSTELYSGIDAFKTSTGELLMLAKFPNKASPFLFKIDAAGSNIWTKKYSLRIGVSGGNDPFTLPPSGALIETKDGGYFYCGRGDAEGETDIGLVKLDDTGGVVWGRIYGNTLNEMGYSVTETDDGGFVVAGVNFSSGMGQSDVYLFKVDSVGNQLWSRGYGEAGHDWCFSMQPTADGGFVLAGYSNSFGNGRQIYLLKTDEHGISACHTRNAITKENSGIIIEDTAVWTSLPAVPEVTASITITPETESDSTHCSSLSVEKIAGRRELKVYPNPANDFITFECEGEVLILISDITGRILLRQTLSAGDGKHQIDISGFSPGLYIYSADKNGSAKSGRFTKY